MAPYRLNTNPITIPVLPLTQSTFLPFGTVIENTPMHRISATAANQGTALKIPSISPLTNNYASAPSQTPANPQTNMFICSPRALRHDKDANELQFDVKILERHPFTTQTFTPMGLSAGDTETGYLVIVCPSQPGKSASSAHGTAPEASNTAENAAAESQNWTREFTAQAGDSSSSQSGTEGSDKGIKDPPDLPNIQAFIARGNQAVTYGPGTWHAPMVVLGKEDVEFVVVQFGNGVPEEDCQEVVISPTDGEEEGIVVIFGEDWKQSLTVAGVKAKI